MNIKEFLRNKKADNEDRHTLETQAARAVDSFRVTAKAMDAAIEAGDIDAYAICKTANEQAQETVMELKGKIANAPKATEAEIVSVWNNHIKDHNRDFEKKRAAYEKARAALCEQFMELVEMQREALELQDAAMDLMDEIRPARPGSTAMVYELRHGPVSSYGFDALAMLPQDDHECKYAGLTAIPEAAFFIGTGELPKSRLSGLNSVVKNRIPCSQEYLANGPDLSAWGISCLF